jgi:hypothetical protein
MTLVGLRTNSLMAAIISGKGRLPTSSKKYREKAS